MPQWKPEDEALFAELCRRAEQQSREAALRAAPAPPPPPPKGAAGALPPRRLRPAGGGAPRRVPSQTAPLAARRPTLDQETLLILVVLAFLLRCRADRELIWGAALYSAFLASLLKNETPDSLGNDTRIAPQNSPKEHRDPRAVLSARGSLFIASFSAAVPFPYRPVCHFLYNTNHYIQTV